ncbi:TPA: lysis protein, partial [Yersinia enterocolitica]|nr:lysis protein [Yersinia enterocolitica]
SFTAYGASAGSILNGVLSYFNPEQWNTIGVLGGIIIAIMTFLTNLVFKIRDDRDRRRMIDAYQSKVEK